MKRIFVGNLPPDVRSRDLEDLFYKFGKIAFIDLKTRRGPPFAFVEFHDYRDAEEAVRARDGKKFDGYRLRVEFPRGRERPSRFKNGSTGTHSRSAQSQRRSKFRVKVSNLPASGSWQDLKDHMREIGEVCFADVYKGGEGVVEFVSYDDMRYAIRKLNNTKFKSHEGESSYIKLKEDMPSSRSRSPRDRSRSRVKSRSRSPVYDKSPVRSYRRSSGDSRSRSRSRTPRDASRSKSISRSVSRSPAYDTKKSPARADKRPASNSRSRSRTPRDRSRSTSRSRSSHSRSPSHDKSPANSDRHSKSNSRTPTPVEDNNHD